MTLGLVYEENKRFAGGAFSPTLKRLEGFDAEGVKSSDIQKAAAFAGPAAE